MTKKLEKKSSKRESIGLKLCPKCNSFQDAAKEKCPNCEYDLTNISLEKNRSS